MIPNHKYYLIYGIQECNAKLSTAFRYSRSAPEGHRFVEACKVVVFLFDFMGSRVIGRTQAQRDSKCSDKEDVWSLKGRKYQQTGEKCVTRNFMIFTRGNVAYN
jgi:hypothetical protein